MSEHEYSQGICQDGAAILKDGQMMTVEEIVKELQQRGQLVDQLKDCLELMQDSETRWDQGLDAPNMNEEIGYIRDLLAELDIQD